MNHVVLSHSLYFLSHHHPQMFSFFHLFRFIGSIIKRVWANTVPVAKALCKLEMLKEKQTKEVDPFDYC